MPTDVQSLLLKIDASTELARRELNKMGGDFDTFTRRSEQAAGGADKAFASFAESATLAKATIIGFVAGIGIEGVISFGRAVLEAADDLGTAADQAGISVERFQTLTESLRVLEVSGDDVIKIFGRLEDTLGSVQGGTAGQGVVDVLDKMGITSRILNGEIDTTDELLDAIAASAGRFSSQAEFTAAVIDIVGKKLGVQFAAAIKDGGVALKAGEQNFRDAGGVIDAEYIAKLADANEAIDRFTAASKAKLITWSGAAIIAFENAGKAAADFFASSANPIGQPGGVRAPSGFEFLNLPAVPFSLADAPTILPSTRSTINDVLSQNGNLRANGLPGFAGDKVPVTRPAAPPKASGAKATRASKPELSPAQLRAQQDLSPTIDSIAAGLGGSLVDLDAIGVRLDDIQAQAVDLSNVDILDLEGLRVGVGLLEDASFSITEGLLGAQNLGDALVDTFARAGASLLQSGILNLLSGGKAGTSFGDAFKGLGSLFSGKGFANGGRPPVGKFSMVGERGPELFLPSVPGTIIPNHMLGGGGGTVQNFDLRGAVVTEALYAEMQARADQAAVRGAIGGSQIAAQDSARRARRSLNR